MDARRETGGGAVRVLLKEKVRNQSMVAEKFELVGK